MNKKWMLNLGLVAGLGWAAEEATLEKLEVKKEEASEVVPLEKVKEEVEKEE